MSLLRTLSAAPKRVVHVCFLLVFIFITLLTWREAVILKEDYEINQRDLLKTTSNTLERFGQRSTDQLFFYRNLMVQALQSPVRSNEIVEQLARFEQQRQNAVWSLNDEGSNTLAIKGVSDSWVQQHALVNRDNSARLQSELAATLGIGMLLHLQDPSSNFHSRMEYISRGGFFLSPFSAGPETSVIYARMVSQPYFKRMTQEGNPTRKMLWTDVYDGLDEQGKVITTSIPVDYNGYWYGVLAMDFSLERLQSFLRQSLPPGMRGNVLVYSAKMDRVVDSDQKPVPGHTLSAEEKQQVLSVMARKAEGTLRVGTRFISWTQSNQFHWVLVNIQTLKEGVAGDTGRAAMVLALMWLLFGGVLIISHQLIIRLFDRMLTLQDSLSFRANYDSLTRLLNRGAFFERAQQLIAQCEQQQQPCAVVQLDLDRFKAINDTWGHQAGDLVLTHAASVIQSAIRTKDIVGRIGGEEFCLALPETDLLQAMDIAERVRMKLASKDVLIDHQRTLNVTVSLGVAASCEAGEYQFESLQSVADRRLYLAKTGGRNRVCGEG